jgi:hypothetical protein
MVKIPAAPQPDGKVPCPACNGAQSFEACRRCGGTGWLSKKGTEGMTSDSEGR